MGVIHLCKNSIGLLAVYTPLKSIVLRSHLCSGKIMFPNLQFRIHSETIFIKGIAHHIQIWGWVKHICALYTMFWTKKDFLNLRISERTVNLKYCTKLFKR